MIKVFWVVSAVRVNKVVLVAFRMVSSVLLISMTVGQRSVGLLFCVSLFSNVLKI